MSFGDKFKAAKERMADQSGGQQKLFDAIADSVAAELVDYGIAPELFGDKEKGVSIKMDLASYEHENRGTYYRLSIHFEGKGKMFAPESRQGVDHLIERLKTAKAMGVQVITNILPEVPKSETPYITVKATQASSLVSALNQALGKENQIDSTLLRAPSGRSF